MKVIGISASYRDNDDLSYTNETNNINQMWEVLSNDYINSVIKANALPLIIPISNNVDLAKEYIDKIDALILSGGTDIDPSFYHEEKDKSIKKTNLIGDRFELELLKYAYLKDIPILCICRGMQLLNIFKGGSLYQDITGHSFKNMMCEYAHNIKIIDNTLLKMIMKDEIRVNSFHHQVIKELGKDLLVSAYSDDGYIEAIEDKNKKFVLGVQFHPEGLNEVNDNHLNIFKELIKSIV